MSIENDVIDIIVEQLGVDREEVSADKSIVEDLKADSLDVTEFIMTLEEKFGCEIPEKDAEKLRTVGDVVKFVTSQIN